MLCSGKVYVDLVGSEQRAQNKQVAIVRVEQLYPFPAADLEAVFASYPNLQEIVWVQEEPENMGAWEYMAGGSSAWQGGGGRCNYVGRRRSSSPAEGLARLRTAGNQRSHATSSMTCSVRHVVKTSTATSPPECRDAACRPTSSCQN